MRLGVISDTHGRLCSQVFDIFAEVDHIIHAGDIGSPDLITELQALAPVTAVYGNTDGFDVRAMYPEVARFELDGFLFLVTHGDQFGSPTPAVLHESYPEAEIIVYGHTHDPLLELVDRTVTVMNPGSARAERAGKPASVGVMELEPGIPPRARIVEL